MMIRTGIEIVNSHAEYRGKIQELEQAIATLKNYSYSKGVLEEQLAILSEEMRRLESTRFQPLEPVTVVNSTLGGRDFYVT